MILLKRHFKCRVAKRSKLFPTAHDSIPHLVGKARHAEWLKKTEVQRDANRIFFDFDRSLRRTIKKQGGNKFEPVAPKYSGRQARIERKAARERGRMFRDVKFVSN